MIFRFLQRSFLNQKKAMALMVSSVAVGTAIAASLVTISLEIGNKVSRELRAFGANITIEPRIEGLADISGQERHLRQEDIIKAKTIFWRHNIIGISPFLQARGTLTSSGKLQDVIIMGAWYEKNLPLPGESGTFPAGIKSVSPWWLIEGRWPANDDQIIIGATLAGRLSIKAGDAVVLDKSSFIVSGTIETGGDEDNQVFMELDTLQQMKGLHGKITRASVSALTTPMDEFAYQDPNTMSKAEYEKWYCTGYVTSIAKQLEEVFQGSRAKPVWQIAETEGRVLERLKLLIYLLCLVVLASSAIGVSTTMIMSLLRRMEEIGLMKAIGADSTKLIAIFLSEGLIIGCLGGLIGYGLSYIVSQYIGITVFQTALEQRSILLPVSLGSAVLISLLGVILPVRKALKIKPSIVLKGAE